MTPCPPDIAPPRVAAVLQAVDRAVQAIPPAFPLEATVAVNPFLGQSGLDFATAAERLARVAGIRLAPARAAFRAALAQGRITEEDLAAALAASACPGRPRSVAELKAALSEEAPDPVALPTIADLAAEESGTDWPAVIARSVGLWAAGHFDRGQALWTPRPGQGAYAAWREWATHDLTPEIAGLEGFCAHVGAAPDSAERAILRAAERLGVVPEAAEGVFHRLLLSLGGWAQHARWVLWQAEAAGGTASTPAELLAIRLVWEEALFERLPAVGAAWRRTVARHAEPVAPSRERVIEAILQDAADRAHQRRLAAALSGPRPAAGPPVLQAVFCIDVRSEVFRRALEAQSPAIATSGFAGFFGLPVAHRPAGRTEAAAHLPVLLRPALRSCEAVAPAEEEARRIGARARRAWGRFRQAAVSSFAFVEAAGPAYGWKLLRDALRLPAGGPRRDAAPRFDPPLDDAQKAATAATVLRAMGLTEGFAPLVLLLGHGGNMRNNAHESAYHCGACGGRTGEVSTRLLAALLNDPGTRAGLGGAGIVIPDDVLFVAGQHDTTTDRVTLFADGPSGAHAAGLAQARAWLDAAGAMARAERALRLPGASAGAIPARARDWAEVRPEWGLAGCAAFIAAPRSATAGRDLGGRAFLHDYDWRRDRDFGTLELILTAPVVVASWISLQYYGSAVAPAAFGGGNKLIHNVVGGIGVVEGNGGLMRAGLPWQAVHDGERLAHEPLRLSVMIEAPRAAIAAVLARHAGLRALFDHGWLHLFALEEGRLAHRYCPGLRWEGQQAVAQAA